MAITIAEVLEQAARDVECISHSREHAAARIRAFAKQYEGCIVAEGEVEAFLVTDKTGADLTFIPPENTASEPLYRARETQR